MGGVESRAGGWGGGGVGVSNNDKCLALQPPDNMKFAANNYDKK